MTFQSINQIKTTVVRRTTTTLDEIDWLYGATIVGQSSTWGIPEASISLWAGQSGIGKSRLAIELARVLSRRGYYVLYFENETTKETFATWVKQDGGLMPPNFYVSESTKLTEQLRDIRSSRAQVVIVDSINMLEEFCYGADQSIKRVIEGYRNICKETNCHIVLLSQLTKRGDPRGSATLSHLVDIVFYLNKQGPDWFAFTVGQKHRYGRTGDNFFSFWGHTDKGLRCLSDYSTEDKLWCGTHGIPINPRIAQVKAEGERFRAEERKEIEEFEKEERKFQRSLERSRVISGFNYVFDTVGVLIAGVLGWEAFRKK